MGRGKSSVPSLIEDKRKRIQTFEKRRKGLEKKAYELSTLCEVDISMIMFMPDDEIKGINDPILWPEDPDITNRMISLYQNKHRTDKNCSRDADIASVFEDRARIVGKEVDKLKKLMKIDDKYPVWDELYDSFSYDQLLMVGNELDSILGGLQSRIDSIRTHRMFQEVSSYNQFHGLNYLNCLGNELAHALQNSQAMKTMYESFNCFGNEVATVLDNSQTMKMMGECSSSSNIYNYSHIVPVPANFDHMIANMDNHLPPLPGCVDNFVQYNNNLVVEHQLQNQYLSYVASQSQKPVLMPSSFSSIDAYSQMVHGENDDAKNVQFGGNIFYDR